MKKNLKIAAIMMLAMTSLFMTSCNKTESGDDGGTSGEVYDLGDGSDNYELKNDMTLSYPNIYNLKGFVYVPAGKTLTIEPGVVVKGDKASKATLIVERGGKLIAQGSADRPIVMTSAKPVGSRKPGDWGGIIICGKAPNNMGEMTIEGGVRSRHGGTEVNDNSGVLSYVRVEFAGVEYSTDNEINGITLGSVGKGTKIDHVQVSYSGDDSFEWFGGSVDAKYIVAYRGWDDDFDTDNGFNGNIQFALGVRDAKIGDKSASNGFESDNNSTAADSDPHTKPVFANVSLFGPVTNPANYVNEAGVNGSPSDARFQAALHLRRNTQLNIYNSLIAGYPVGLIVENDKGSQTQTHATGGVLNVSSCVMAGMVKNYQDKQFWSAGSQLNTSDAGVFAKSYFERSGGANRALNLLADLKLSGVVTGMDFSVFPQSGSPLASGASWSSTNVSSGFEKVGFIGAFGPTETPASNWMSRWCNFDPQNTVY